MSTEHKWQRKIEILLPNTRQPQILVQQATDRWRLPQALVEQTETPLLSRISSAIRQAWGLETTVLQETAGYEDKAAHLNYSTFLLEIHSDDWAPPGNMRWIGAGEVDKIVFDYPNQRAAVETHFHEVEQGTIPSLRVPWARPGWQHQAEIWIQTRMGELGYQLIGPIEQVRNWFLSCVLRAPTDKGAVFFKATNGSALMVHEAQFTQALSLLLPQAVPKPLCIEPRQHWMLLPDFGKEVGHHAPVETRGAILSAFAQIQISTTPWVDDLLALGCCDRRLSILAAQIEPLFGDPEVMAGIDAEQQSQLLAAAPRLREMCAALDHYFVPDTLVHGDMHMGNVAHRGKGYLFFDWTDACIAHPFLDMLDIVHEQDAAVQTRLRDQYLSHWLAYEPMERLLEMWKLAYPLCALHQAVSYYFIRLNTEERCKYEFGWAMPFWFGKILEGLDMHTIAHSWGEQ